MELTGEAEKLAKRLHSRDEEAAERHAVDAFLRALNRTLAAEVQKLGLQTMEEAVATARRIEKILEEQTDTKLERLVSTMQDQIRILKKDLREANEQITAHKATATPWPLFPLLLSQSLNRLLPLLLPLVTSTRSTVKILSFTALPANRWTDDHLTASSPFRLQLPNPSSSPAPSPPASMRQQPQTALRTNTGAAATRGRIPSSPQRAFKLLKESPEVKVTPVGCAVGPPITGQLNLEGIPVLGLVDICPSVTCMGFLVWWQYHAQRGPLKPFEVVIHGAHSKPLHIAGKTQHLNLQWGEARGRTCFIVIIGLESPPILIGMDIIQRLRVRNDVTNGTAMPVQPDPQTIHLNAAQKQDPPPTSRALLLQTTDIPNETACLVRRHNPWPNEDVYFCPEEALPTFVSGVPVLSSGSEVWVAIHNHRPEPLRLHAGQNVGTLETVALADSPPPPPPPQSRLQASSPATYPGTPVAHPAATAEGPLPGIQ